MDASQLDQYCRLGEKADHLCREGKTRDALKVYQEIFGKLERGDIDSYLMAKVTLGVLRAHVKLGEFKDAYSIWNAGMEESLFGLGIYALESAQTTVHDMITYDMLCAFLHSLSMSDKQSCADAINQYMSRVCEHAEESGDRDLMRLALSNWKQHLREVFPANLPHAAAQPLIHFERDLDEAVKPRSIDFPMPTEWEKPRDFSEMSRVVQLKAKQSPHGTHMSEHSSHSNKTANRNVKKQVG